jgi:hypothetical protein
MIMLNGLKNSAKIFPNFLNKWKTEGCAYWDSNEVIFALH